MCQNRPDRRVVPHTKGTILINWKNKESEKEKKKKQEEEERGKKEEMLRRRKRLRKKRHEPELKKAKRRLS